MTRYNDLIDRIDGFTVGTLVIENDSLYLDNFALTGAKTIEVLNGVEYVSVSYEDCINTKTNEGWPLFGGLYARAKF